MIVFIQYAPLASPLRYIVHKMNLYRAYLQPRWRLHRNDLAYETTEQRVRRSKFIRKEGENRQNIIYKKSNNNNNKKGKKKTNKTKQNKKYFRYISKVPALLCNFEIIDRSRQIERESMRVYYRQKRWVSIAYTRVHVPC